jgi:hypothetical protein
LLLPLMVIAFNKTVHQRAELVGLLLQERDDFLSDSAEKQAKAADCGSCQFWSSII